MRARHERHACDTSNRNATLALRVRHERHECNTSATRVLHERHVEDTSATRTTQVRHEWKFLILITAQVKKYFHTPIFTIWQVKDYKERNNFILRTNFCKCLIPMPKCVKKCTTKTELFNGKSYIKKLYTRL